MMDVANDCTSILFLGIIFIFQINEVAENTIGIIN